MNKQVKKEYEYAKLLSKVLDNTARGKIVNKLKGGVDNGQPNGINTKTII